MTQTTREDWYTLDTLTFLDFEWINHGDGEMCFSMKIVEGLTHDNEVVEVTYYADGDYVDRWCDVTGRIRDIIYWRPCRA